MPFCHSVHAKHDMESSVIRQFPDSTVSITENTPYQARGRLKGHWIAVFYAMTKKKEPGYILFVMPDQIRHPANSRYRPFAGVTVRNNGFDISC